MTGLDRKVMRQFYRDENFVSVEELTERSGIQTLFQSSTIVDAHSFEPLGYSLNSLDGRIYSTLHITPQPECSYVSYETNYEPEKFHMLIDNILELFKPESFTVLIVSDTIPLDSTHGVFPNYFPRGTANHDFTGTGNVLTWYSFRKPGTFSPPQIQPLTSSTCAFHEDSAMFWEEEKRFYQLWETEEVKEEVISC